MFERLKSIKWLNPLFDTIVAVLVAYVAKMKPESVVLLIILVAVMYSLYKALPWLYTKVYTGQAKTDKQNELSKQIELKKDSMKKFEDYIKEKEKLLKKQGISDEEIKSIIKSDIEKFNKKIYDADKLL